MGQKEVNAVLLLYLFSKVVSSVLYFRGVEMKK